jgi:hypothetical protein
MQTRQMRNAGAARGHYEQPNRGLRIGELKPPSPLPSPPRAGVLRAANGGNGGEQGGSTSIKPNQTGSSPIKTEQGQFKLKAQAVGSNLAGTNLHFGRARWRRGNAERLNGKAKGLNDRNTCFICDTDERGSGLEENLRLSSLNRRKNVCGRCARPPGNGEGGRLGGGLYNPWTLRRVE